MDIFFKIIGATMTVFVIINCNLRCFVGLRASKRTFCKKITYSFYFCPDFTQIINCILHDNIKVMLNVLDPAMLQLLIIFTVNGRGFWVTSMQHFLKSLYSVNIFLILISVPVTFKYLLLSIFGRFLTIDTVHLTVSFSPSREGWQWIWC